MRRIARLSMVAGTALAVLSSFGTPAWAAGAVGGTVSGTVTISPGIDLNSNGLVQAITFAPIALSGSFVPADPTKAFIGGITTSIVFAHSTAESTTMGVGTIDAFTFDETTPTGVIVNGKCNQGGRYQRVGSVVVVNLTCSATINGSPFGGGVTVLAQFTPTDGNNGVTGKIRTANFTGAYVAAG